MNEIEIGTNMKKEEFNYRIQSDLNPCHDCASCFLDTGGLHCHVFNEKVDLTSTCDLWRIPVHGELIIK